MKSAKMKSQINLNNVNIIPNGVDLEKMVMLQDRDDIRQELKLTKNKKYVLFIADPARKEKNYQLCVDSVNSLKDPRVELLPVYNVSHEKVVKYLHAADILMLTSFTEGSPNIIKEALATNCPIVTTNVGDVEYLLGDTDGCYILNSFEIKETAEMLKRALAFNKRTNGVNRIKELGLDSKSISNKITQLYFS